jgi:hypothetical protein
LEEEVWPSESSDSNSWKEDRLEELETLFVMTVFCLSIYADDATIDRSW